MHFFKHITEKPSDLFGHCLAISKLVRMSIEVLRRAMLFLLLIIAGSLGTASARIGWTLEECVQKYGRYYIANKEKAGYSFRVGDMLIDTYFLHGSVAVIMYHKGDEGTFTADEIGLLMEKNGGEKEWAFKFKNHETDGGMVYSVWETKDGSLYTLYVTKSRKPCPSVMVLTRAAVKFWGRYYPNK
jgi:hypothetical protein